MLRIGLTGGVACGKSTIAAMLVKHGACYLEADSLVLPRTTKWYGILGVEF